MVPTVECTIQDIMLLAQAKWNTPLTLALIARSIGVNMNMLSRLKNQRTGAIRTTTLGRVCQYFWCQPGELLVVRSALPGRLPDTVVRRPAFPTEPITDLPLINRIPVLLRGHSPTTIANETGLSRTAVYQLMAGRPMKQIMFSTLAVLCDVLQVGVDSLLQVELPRIEDGMREGRDR